MSDEKFIITAEEAESLLSEGEYVHNFIQAGLCLVGCDYSRGDAIDAFKQAKLIEIGGDGCKSMRHPVVVHENDNHYSFFEADMDKVEALESSRAASSTQAAE